VERLQEILGREVKEVYELRGGLVRLQEAVGGHPDPFAAFLWTGRLLADEYPDRLTLEDTKEEILIRLKIR